MAIEKPKHSSSKRKEGGGKFGNSKKKQKIEVDDDLGNSAKRRALKKERQSHRRHADVVADAKIIWNTLRLKDGQSAKEKEELMIKLMNLIRGKIYEIALQHDASRVVQAAIQFGNAEQRQEVLDELLSSSEDKDGKTASNLPELSKIQYAHFVTLKLIKYCSRGGNGNTNEECMKKIVKAFKGSIPKLAVHSVGSRVLENLLMTFPTKYTIGLKQELYGPHFSLFFDPKNGGPPPTLKSNLELDTTTTTQRETTISFVKDIISKGITKGFFGYKYFQDLLVEYLDIAEVSDIRDILPSIVDHSIHLISTKNGTRVVTICSNYATPKDRKRIMRSFKGYTKSSLVHQDAYLAILRLIQVTDDTVSINKSILNELITEPKDDADDKKDVSSPLLELALDETASKLFLLLLVKDDATRMKYFNSYERSVLFPTKQPTVKESGGQELPTSKKDNELRRKELLKYLFKQLVELCSDTENVKQLVSSIPGSRVLKEVYSNLIMGGDDIDSSLDVEPIINSCVKVCNDALDVNGDNDSSDDDEDGDDEKEVSLFEDPVGHLVIKHLILVDSTIDSSDDDKPTFSKAFMEELGDQLMDVANSNRGAFVVSALLKVSSVRDDVISKLGPKTSDGKKLKKLFQSMKKKKSKEGDKKKQPTAGYEALLKDLSS